jgi:pyruvate formate lyase activating enzyme
MFAEGKPAPATAGPAPLPPKECMFYTANGKEVACELCPHACVVGDGERGLCGVRENRGGRYNTLVYDRVCALNVDPIEKKPFFHYLPGTDAVSIATAGCNFTCRFCQNYEISQAKPEAIPHDALTRADLVALALKRAAPTIAYTYSEPVIFYEMVHDTAKLGRERGVGSVMVTNGFINEKPMRELANHLTAVKVDLKAFTEKYYADVCGGRLKEVLDTLKVLRSTGIHLEIVVLVVPTLNDGADEFRRMCGWIVENLGPDVPVHFIRFHPSYRMQNLPMTPVKTVELAHDEAVKAGVRYCYVGNVPMHPFEHTYCHSCKTRLIERAGMRVKANLIADGRCPKCASAIPGVWSQKQALAFKPKA